jgi:hypothetical protein
VVEVSARLFLLSVLALGMYSDLESNLQNEGDAIRADDSYCTMHGEKRCAEVDHCEWDASNLLCATIAHPSTRIGFLQHVLWGLPGLAPLVLNQIFKRLESSPVHADETGVGDPAPLPSEQCIVARVYCTTKGTQVRRRLSSEQGGARFSTPPRGAGGSAASIDPVDIEATVSTISTSARLERWPEESGADAGRQLEAATSHSEEDAEFILSMNFEEAVKACKDNGLPVSGDLQMMQQALLAHFASSTRETEAQSLERSQDFSGHMKAAALARVHQAGHAAAEIRERKRVIREARQLDGSAEQSRPQDSHPNKPELHGSVAPVSSAGDAETDAMLSEPTATLSEYMVERGWTEHHSEEQQRPLWVNEKTGMRTWEWTVLERDERRHHKHDDNGSLTAAEKSILDEAVAPPASKRRPVSLRRFQSLPERTTTPAEAEPPRVRRKPPALPEARRAHQEERSSSRTQDASLLGRLGSEEETEQRRISAARSRGRRGGTASDPLTAAAAAVAAAAGAAALAATNAATAARRQ